MPSRSPNSPLRDRLIGTVLAAGLVLIACRGPASRESAAPDRVLAGPQGAVGQFVVECGFSHLLADDPIVHPGRPGASHLHQFFGSTGSSATSTSDELRAGDTTCDQPSDTASYWTPTLVGADGEVVHATKVVAYYRAGEGVDPPDVVAYPAGFTSVAGDASATEPQPLSVVAWSCGRGGDRAVRPPACPPASTLRLNVVFQDCWDGGYATSPDPARPAAHVAYSSAGRCPPFAPVAVPQLQLAIDFPPVARSDLDGLRLSSGDILSGHADFWNTWDQTKLANEVTECLHRDLPCGISG